MTLNDQEALTLKERELELVLALDRVRDTFEDEEDPQAMIDQLVALLKTQFEADACALVLVAETSDDIEASASISFPESAAVKLCQEAMQFESPKPVTGSRWPHTLGIRVILKDFPLGGLVLARESRLFSQSDIQLLTVAESQIDSAILQARTVWKLLQRNRELQGIYAIDRLRDHTSKESDLITGFTTILLDHFKAALCMIILSQADSGELILRGVVDKQDLQATTLDLIRQQTQDLRIAQVIPTPPDIQNFVLLAAPLLVNQARLGAVVVGREERFTLGDHRLLHAMTSQMDSAIAHSRVNQQLFQRTKELEVIYQIDHIRDRETDFDTMLQRVLKELCETVSGELGYIMLYSETGEQHLELKASTVEAVLTSPEYAAIIQRFSRTALDSGELVWSNEPDGPVRSIVAVPLILNERIIGVFGSVNSGNARGFSPDDRRMLSAITSQVDTAIFERLEQRKMRKVLSRSVDPKVMEHLLHTADADILQGKRVDLSVLFADLRGSTEWAERVAPEDLVTTLNTFLGRMTEVIFKHGGTLDKFVGDQVIGLFGTPVPMDDHAYLAASAALEMQAVHGQLQADLEAEGRELPALGIGISTGEAIAGEFGAPNYTDFTAIGRIVNLGARICSAADAGQVLISQSTYDMIRHHSQVTPVEALTLKGIAQPTRVFALHSVNGG